MRFAIRDDDVCYFTKTEDLEIVYRDIWNSIPVSLAVVPFQACTINGAVPKEYWEGDETFPIGHNKILVSFLKEKIKEKKVSIMMHGYSHKNYMNGYEFETGDALFKKVKEGKDYLERLFGEKITVFVPPHNAVSRKGLDAIAKNGLNILASVSFNPLKRPYSLEYIEALLRRRFFHFRYKKNCNQNIAYPFIHRFRHHAEMECSSLIPTTKWEELIASFVLAYKLKGNFCLATHYWEVIKTDNIKLMLRELVKNIMTFYKKVQFCNADDLFH